MCHEILCLVVGGVTKICASNFGKVMPLPSLLNNGSSLSDAIVGNHRVSNTAIQKFCNSPPNIWFQYLAPEGGGFDTKNCPGRAGDGHVLVHMKNTKSLPCPQDPGGLSHYEGIHNVPQNKVCFSAFLVYRWVGFKKVL